MNKILGKAINAAGGILGIGGSKSAPAAVAAAAKTSGPIVTKLGADKKKPIVKSLGAQSILRDTLGGD